MSLIKPAALTAAFLIGMLVCEVAWADETEVADDYAKLPICTLNADGTRLAVEPCRTAPARKPMPRRPVPQIIDPMPTVARPQQPAMPPVTPSPPLPSLTSPPRAPVPVTGCDTAGCYGANGVRYNNVGKGVITPSGKTCTRAGGAIQC
ncbi:hypothetical protein FHW58_003455 [Duganella sp. 1224]|uniref:hypothetical protein n=1 Tax=Duganella sp. 1224 TaxID=2587052 RepID=UPI0015CEA6DB|nr:hypothetical protein [Duganella sp. 1224]NYE62240.1 hypothetical protein [Duganella sp. 1224]